MRTPKVAKAAALWGQSILYDIQGYHRTKVGKGTALWGRGVSLNNVDEEFDATKAFFSCVRAANVPPQNKSLFYELRASRINAELYNDIGEYDPQIEFRYELPTFDIEIKLYNSDMENMFVLDDLIPKIYKNFFLGHFLSL